MQFEHRYQYHIDRHLIPSARVLSPQFADRWVFLTGAQVEILRNLIDYANDPRTFVDEYCVGYYINTTQEDFDEIQAIVADLEDTLMAGGNVPWGYGAIYNDRQIVYSASGGTNTLAGSVVAAGQVWRVTHLMVYANAACTSVTIAKVVSAAQHYIRKVIPMAASAIDGVECDVVLESGENIQASFYGCTAGTRLEFVLLGYKMFIT